MVFENLTKSLKGVTTSLTNTVSDSFDSITSPIQGLSKSITGSNDSRERIQEGSRHDEYKHWWIAESQRMMQQSCWSSLATTKKQAMNELLTFTIEQTINEGWTPWNKAHIKNLQAIRKNIKESTLQIIDHTSKNKILGKKTITLPQKDQTQRVVSFEEFVMNCQQRSREVEKNCISIQTPKVHFSLDEKKEAIHGYSQEITKKSFGIILDHGKLAAVTHSVVKLLKKIESLEELKDSSFDGEEKRYDKKISEVTTELELLYTQEWTKALEIIKEGYAMIAKKSESIHTDRLTLLAQKSEFESVLITDQKIKNKSTVSELKIRTKKLKLLQKKYATYLTKYKKHISTVDSISSHDEKSIEDARNHRQENTSSLTQILTNTYYSCGSTLTRQSHTLIGFNEYLLKNNDQISSLIKRLVHVGKQVESEYSLTQNHLKKLIRDVRSLHADIHSTQPGNTRSQKFENDLATVIEQGERQTTTLKTRKNETKKQTSSVSNDIQLTKKTKKKLVNGCETVLSQLEVHMCDILIELSNQRHELYKQLKNGLQELGSNKKLFLPKTSIHDGVWKQMRNQAEIITKEFETIQTDIHWLTSKKENSIHHVASVKKDTVEKIISLEGVLI